MWEGPKPTGQRNRMTIRDREKKARSLSESDAHVRPPSLFLTPIHTNEEFTEAALAADWPAVAPCYHIKAKGSCKFLFF